MATTTRIRPEATAAQPPGFEEPARHGLRFYQVEGDRMAPTIRHRDFVLLAPTNRFIGDGYYLIANMYGDPVPYSCDGFAGTRSKPRIRMCAHNKHYADQTMPLGVVRRARAR